jgi:hypothetical protein
MMKLNRFSREYSTSENPVTIPTQPISVMRELAIQLHDGTQYDSKKPIACSEVLHVVMRTAQKYNPDQRRKTYRTETVSSRVIQNGSAVKTATRDLLKLDREHQ